MNSNLLLAVVCFVMVLVASLFITRPSTGDDHHPLHRDFYQTWKQPGTELSCCNARIEVNGQETGDCEPTASRFIAGRWYAQLPHHGAFIEVPEAKILRERNPTIDGTDGHLCFTPSQGVMCFVPPFGGG